MLEASDIWFHSGKSLTKNNSYAHARICKMCTAVGGRPTVEDGHIVMVEVTAPQAGPPHTTQDSAGEDEPLAPSQGAPVGRNAAKKRKERDSDVESEDEPRRRKVCASPLFICPSMLTSEIFCRESRAAACNCCQGSDLSSILRTDLSSLLLGSVAKPSGYGYGVVYGAISSIFKSYFRIISLADGIPYYSHPFVQYLLSIII